MKWETVSASEYCESVRDGTHDTPKPSPAGYKLITGKHIKGGQIETADAYYISEKDYTAINTRSLVEQWDVIMSMIGTVGEVAVVKEPPDYAIKNIALFKTGGSELRGKWLAYYLQSPIARGHMFGNMNGSSQQFLSLRQLRELPILTTEEPYMQQVVDVLSSYDALIVNNQKQIKLLEEAAQRLYKEWFVDLRFPGYEDVPVVDGVPERWKRVCLESICLIRKSALTRKEIPVGVPYIGLEHMPRNSICLHNWGESSEVNSNKFQYKEKDILFGKIRPYFHKVGFTINDGIASTDSIIMYPNGRFWGLLLMTVSSDSFVKFTSQSSKDGAKMPRADWNQMKAYSVLIAEPTVQSKFESLIEAITNRIKHLAIQNRNLEEARDRLLPKLMSGELEV